VYEHTGSCAKVELRRGGWVEEAHKRVGCESTKETRKRQKVREKQRERQRQMEREKQPEAEVFTNRRMYKNVHKHSEGNISGIGDV
jgi:hypothetical protein